MMKRSFPWILALVLTLILTACGTSSNGASSNNATSPSSSQPVSTKENQTSAGNGNNELRVIRMAVLDQQPGTIFYTISEKGWDVENGFKLDLQVYASGAPANEALGAKLWDVAGVGAAAVNSIRTYDAVQIMEYFTPARGIKAIVRADSPIMSVKGANPNYPELYGDADSMRGATILLPVGSGHHICAAKWLELVGLNESDVDIVHMEFAQAYQAFKAGEGDIFMSTFPYTDMLTDEGYKIACEMPDTRTPYFDNIVVAKDFWKTENEELLVKLLQQILRASDFFASNPDEYVALHTEWLAKNGKSTDDKDALYKSSMENYFMTTEEAKNYEVGSSLLVIADFMAQQGTITEADLNKVESSIKPEIMERALENS